MPYRSKAQAAYFNIHRDEMERQGVDVDEWNRVTKGKKLPQRVSHSDQKFRKMEGELNG